MPVIVRAVTGQDLPWILAIQAASSDAAQWSQDSYMSLFGAGASGYVASDDDQLLGFLILHGVADEAEILNLAIAPASRRRGVGSLLLREALNWARQSRITRIHLEVRASNHAARKFYLARGFRITGLRPGYYSSPPEDAVLLSRAVAVN